MGDGLVELVAEGRLDDVVHVTDILRREDACEIARVANGLYLVESGEGTDHGVGRTEVLSLHEGAQILIVPLTDRPHRSDAEDGQQQDHYAKHDTPESVSGCNSRDGSHQRQESHPTIIDGETPRQTHHDRHIERT